MDNLYRPPRIVKIVKCGRLRGTAHVARTAETSNACGNTKIDSRKAEGG